MEINSIQYRNSKIFASRFDFLLLVLFLCYFVVWYYITSLRLLSLNATYFDLGSFYERLWFISTYSWTPLKFLAVFSNTGFQFLLFPLTYFRSYELILAIQTAAIGLCVIPLYGISKIFLKSQRLSLLLSSSFFIYFPVAGSNFFDAHFQAFFPILFLFGYYFFLRRNYVVSLFLFFLSGTVRYPYFIFPALFAFLGAIETLYHSKMNLSLIKGSKLKEFIFYLVLLIISSVLLMIRALTAGPLTAVTISNSSFVHYQLFYRLLTVLLLFFPLLFLPVLSKKWVLFYAPMVYLIFNGPSIYYYPTGI